MIRFLCSLLAAYNLLSTCSTFLVDDVPVATTPYRAAENVKEIFARHSSKKDVLEAFSIESLDNKVLLESYGELNSFIETVHLSYANHYPLEITPDDIWLCISQGFAAHVNKNAEKLRHMFVEHEGKKELKVRRDDFVKGSSNNSWPDVFTNFSAQIRNHIGNETHDLLLANFTTTGPVERAATEIVMMKTFEKYFSYKVWTLCGIPEITLKGTVEDWKQVREKTIKLAQFDLEWWTDPLVEVLDMFVASSQGTNMTRQFWSSFYKESDGGYFTDMINGWIVTLFPYQYSNGKLSRNQLLNKSFLNDIKTSWSCETDDSTHGIDSKSIPSGVTRVPFIWEYFGINYRMNFIAGFMGTKQDPISLTVSPVIGWSIDSLIDEVYTLEEEVEEEIFIDDEELGTENFAPYHEQEL